MLHEEILAKAGDYHAGRLTRAERSEMDHHLGRCRDCRVLIGRWSTAAPGDGFEAAVMAKLGFPGEDRMKRLAWVGTVAAALLVATAFYHPEHRWLETDASFAWSAAQAPHLPPVKRGTP